jgi:hypothetical protein
VRTQTGATGPSPSVEASIKALLVRNITVIASANNQNGNACDTTPGRMSINNPIASVANDVITAGGSMMLNRPWSVDLSDVPGSNVQEASGGGKGPETPFDATKGITDARWVCGAGDSAACSNSTPIHTRNPNVTDATATSYTQFTGGSNAGPCVTLFAPAKNIFVATPAAANGYRDARLEGGGGSGTSWSAPIVAGFAARILQANPTFTPTQVRTALLSNSVSALDPTTLNSFDHLGAEITGTPNKLLRFGDVNITTHPISTAASGGTTNLQVTAGGTSALQYQWYVVDSDFDLVTYRRGAHDELSSTAISGATHSSYAAPAVSTPRGYWVRVSNGCGSSDSDIAVVVPPPAPPTNVHATAVSGTVTLTWSTAAGAERYRIERTTDGSWTTAGEITPPSTLFTERPTAAGGIVVYRVVVLAGLAHLTTPASATSVNDFANLLSDTYEELAVAAPFTTVRGQHLVELREAVNALAHAVGAPEPYTADALDVAELQGEKIHATDFTGLRDAINAVRTFPALGLPPVSLTEVPDAGARIRRVHLEELRAALD